MKTRWTMLAVLLAALAGTVGSPAPARADRMDDLKSKFEGRFPKLARLKDAGKVGETTAGYLEAVRPEFAGDGEVKPLLDDENADRRELYRLIAEKERTTAEKVAERNAARNFQRADRGHYLKARDGEWKRKG